MRENLILYQFLPPRKKAGIGRNGRSVAPLWIKTKSTHFVGWNERYYETLLFASTRIKEWKGGIKSAQGKVEALKKTLLARTVTFSAGELLQHGDGESRSEPCTLDHLLICGFCNGFISSDCIIYLGCEKSFHPETLCVGVYLKMIDLLVTDKSGTVNYSGCASRVSIAGGSRSAQSALSQLFKVVDCLVGQVIR